MYIILSRDTISKRSKLHFRSRLSIILFYILFFFFNSELIFSIVYSYGAIADCFFIICLRLDLSDLLMTRGTSRILRGRGVNQRILLSRTAVYMYVNAPTRDNKFSYSNWKISAPPKCIWRFQRITILLSHRNSNWSKYTKTYNNREIDDRNNIVSLVYYIVYSMTKKFIVNSQ